MKINIAIDGPAGSGKSTVAEQLAQKLGYQFVDTGLTYRGFTYWCLKNEINFTDQEAVKKQLTTFKYHVVGGNVFVNDEDVTNKLQNTDIIDNINKITGLDFVREAMVKLQQSLGNDKGVVMVGRDTTTVVLPMAEVKVYLTASLTVRAERRWKQNAANGINPNDLNEIQEKLRLRDYADENRTVGPLQIADDAIVIDTSDQTIDQAVTAIYNLVIKKVGN
ncbi:cytidylate kinase [Spiroplasma syrphidicola EA-1]|uniref:Cytidylate kinase n=1 Tax=Spiroplasma syrphidicola EA-1 TaxID=1276229 RepID=R4U5M1_9MOLU|nr:(d)CMP kinase [Spiroplasma syrphidicola]AGM25903.1 cytidylate kinase [Spiroplasma syrphidicola EA-1]